jgi:UDP-glucose 4-epimerase
MTRRRLLLGALAALAAGAEWRSPLALAVGAKGYHAEATGPYTVR